MCFSGGGDDGTSQQMLAMQQQEAADARAKEADRQARITAGKAKIDAAFDGTQSVVGHKAVTKHTTFQLPTTGAPVGFGGQAADYSKFLPKGFTFKEIPGVAAPAAPGGFGGYGVALQPSGVRGKDYDESWNQTGGGVAAPTGPKSRWQLLGADGKAIGTYDNQADAFGKDIAYQGQDDILGPKHGGFDDAFYKRYHDDFMGYYQPQLDKQFGDARNELTYALARAGTLNSSMGLEKAADVKGEYDTQQGAINSQATNAVNKLKGTIGNEKSALYSELEATGDSARAANEATSKTRVLAASTPEYNPLGDIFTGITSGIGQYNAGVQAAGITAAGGLGARSPRRQTATNFS